MKLNLLKVTQNHLRKHCSLPEMINHIRKGGRWDKDSMQTFAMVKGAEEAMKGSLYARVRAAPLIQISHFPHNEGEGDYYIHDGHHRCVCTLLGGRDFLYNNEYKITERTYDQYMEINFKCGWVTPFDPRQHCRAADIGLYKLEMEKMNFRFGEQVASQKVWEAYEGMRYLENREIETLSELAERSFQQLEEIFETCRTNL